MMPVPPASDPLRIAHESRRWATFAHLSVLAYFGIPFGGLFATALIYSMRTEDLPLAREHQRRALNFNVLLSVLSLLTLIVSLSLFPSFLGMMTSLQPSPSHPGDLPPGFARFFETIFGILGIAAVVALSVLTMAGIGAWRAWQGKTYGYLISLPVVRPRP